MSKKAVLIVLAIALLAFSGGIAQAATENPGALGDALVYGYYNGIGGFNFLRVVNTSQSFGVGAKVRFREGRNSNEVLDFLICLSAGDQWSGWVSDFGTTGSARLLWWDNDTPTYPDPQGDDDVTNNIPSDLLTGTIPFATGATGANLVVTSDDTKEGYVEIIGTAAWADTPGAAKVVSTPRECGQTLGVQGVTAADPNFVAPALVDVPNSLTGTMYIIKGFGVYPYNATALADFRIDPITSVSLATDNAPLLSDAQPGGLTDTNLALTKTRINAMYDIETGLGGGTDIVVNFPTKRRSIQTFVDNGPFNDCAAIDANGAIVNNATVGTDNTTILCRCEQVDVTIWDDAEARTTTKGCTFSPCTPTTVIFKLCNEVTVVTIGGPTTTSILGSLLVSSQSAIDVVSNQTTVFGLGWVQFDLTSHELDASGVEKVGQTRLTGNTLGMPVIGYSVGSFINGNFASMVPVSYEIQ